MARFYAGCQGARGHATRLGTDSATAFARGWNAGVEVQARAEDRDGGARDVFMVYATGGSNGSNLHVPIAQVTYCNGRRRIQFLSPDGQAVSEERDL